MALKVTKKAESAVAPKHSDIVEVYLAHGSKHRAGVFIFEKGIVYQVSEDEAKHLFDIVISNEQKFEQAGIKQKGLPRKVASVSLGGANQNTITVPDDDEITAHVAKAHTGEATQESQDGGTGDSQEGDGTEGAVSV